MPRFGYAQHIIVCFLVCCDARYKNRAEGFVAHDPRENDDGLSLGGRGFHYLADLVLRSGQTYLGDVVAMGGRPVGRGVGGNRPLVHKVEPGESSQVVLIVDWGVEKEA